MHSPERTGRILERAAQALAVLCLILVIVLNGRPYFTASSYPPRGIMDPHVAMQMALSVKEVDAIVGEAPSADREVMRIKQYADFAFIPAYGALFVVMSWALARVSRWAWLIAVFGVFAALHDVLENRDILSIINVPLSAVTAQMILHLHRMSVVKWFCAALAIGTLGAFAIVAGKWHFRAIGAIDLIAAGMILWGVTDNPTLVWAGMVMGVGMIASAATLQFLIADFSNKT